MEIPDLTMPENAPEQLNYMDRYGAKVLYITIAIIIIQQSIEYLVPMAWPMLIEMLETVVFNPHCKSKSRLDGKTAIVTGCNTGIGKETVLQLVKRGARVIMACRDLKKSNEAAEEIRTRTSSCEGVGQVVVVRLDLASLASVRQCASVLLDTEPSIHLLVNNAGVFACPKSLTEDGLEMQIGVNHFGHFLFTCLLLPRIISSAPARILNLSSVAHLGANLSFEDMNCEKCYSPVTAYTRSKLANILFTKELAIRLKGTGVTTYAVHPGIIDTNISRHLNASFFRGARWLFKYFTSKTVEQGSQTTLHCALDEELSNESGHYYSNCRKASSSLRSKDPELASRLWQESVRIVGLGECDPVCVKDQDLASSADT